MSETVSAVLHYYLQFKKFTFAVGTMTIFLKLYCDVIFGNFLQI